MINGKTLKAFINSIPDDYEVAFHLGSRGNSNILINDIKTIVETEDFVQLVLTTFTIYEINVDEPSCAVLDLIPDENQL